MITSDAIAHPVPVGRYHKDPILDSAFHQELSTLGPLYVDHKFEVPSSIIAPLLELDATEFQPLGFATGLDIVQTSQSSPAQAPSDYTEYQGLFYQSFQCGNERSVCCSENDIVYLGQIRVEGCNMSSAPFLLSLCH